MTLRLLSVVNAVPTILFRVNLGVLFGRRFLMITTRGRKTGMVRRSVVEVVENDDSRNAWTVFAAHGPGTGWYRNATSGGPVVITIGRRRFLATVDDLDREARLAVLGRYQTAHPRTAALLGRAVLGQEFSAAAGSLESLADGLRCLRFTPR